jgi:hypothetical protein
MTWQLTEWGKTRDNIECLKEFFPDKSKNWIPEGGSFILPGMGAGHFYLEEEHIYYNPSCRKSVCDGAVMEWKE